VIVKTKTCQCQNIDYLAGDSLEEFEDTKEDIRIRKSTTDRQHNGQKKKNRRTSNDLQNRHIKLKIEYHEPH